jgi:hypothetical protein
MTAYQSKINTQILAKNPKKDVVTNTNTWLYNANDLNSYISAANKIQYIQVSLCLNRGTMDLIMFGIDSSGQQMYFKYNNTSCVLENANPCPICELNNPLPSLTAPKSN